MSEELASLIIEIAASGIKATEIPVKLAERDPKYLATFDPRIIQKLVDAGELVEVEYVLPQLAFRAKSFLLPAGTTVRVSGGLQMRACARCNKPTGHFASEQSICDTCHEKDMADLIDDVDDTGRYGSAD